MAGFCIYITTGEADGYSFLPLWVQWIKRHYPQWAMVDIDSQTDPSLFPYLQKAMSEHEYKIIFVDVNSRDEPLGKIISLLQRISREQHDQTTLILQGQHQVIEKIGLAFCQFYQSASDEETKRILHLVLGNGKAISI